MGGPFLFGIVLLPGCPPRGMDSPPIVPATQPDEAMPAPAAAGTRGAQPRRAAPASGPSDGSDLVAVPPWVDLDDPKDHTWVEGMRRALRAVAPQAARCREEAPAAAPACLCKVLCTVKLPPLKQREGQMEISYPPLPGGGPSLRSFRLRPDGSVESCTIREGDPSQPGSRTTEIVWCTEQIGGAAPKK